ncbi:hypothetical protein ACFL1V_03530 [Pseudomonadota bacterium]
MAHIRIVIAIIFILVSGSCLAQASLVMKNGDGKTIGWLLSKHPELGEYQYLTPDGFILTLSWRHWVTTSNPDTPDKLLYELSDCDGQAWVNQSFYRFGEIYQLDGAQATDVFVRQDLTNAGSFSIDVASEKGTTGACINIVEPYADAGRRVEQIDPVEYGLMEHPNQGIHAWIVFGPNKVVEKPELISCDGFESCPTP